MLKDALLSRELKAAYVQESFYIGAENLEALVNIKSKNELIGDGFVAVTGEERYLCSSIRWKHYSWSSQDSRRKTRIN